MDEERVVSPALPGAAVRPAQVVRATRTAARDGGRDGRTPPRTDREPAVSRPAEQPGGGEGEQQVGGLRVAVRREGRARVVSLGGELDHGSANGLWTALSRPVAGGEERIVVDLTGLRFCDSTGLNLLPRSRLDAEAAGLRLGLAGPGPVVARLFAITEADTALRIHPDLDAALKTADPPQRGCDDVE
ncbi:STAS domain-containing protein [Kitasatospora sp. NPDC088779]|uniref:STAS domain-containing protein n=1 Tax=unclassified Kitasatospora TaxID=2633591 RepID=UPI003429BF9C